MGSLLNWNQISQYHLASCRIISLTNKTNVLLNTAGDAALNGFSRKKITDFKAYVIFLNETVFFHYLGKKTSMF